MDVVRVFNRRIPGREELTIKRIEILNLKIFIKGKSNKIVNEFIDLLLCTLLKVHK